MSALASESTRDRTRPWEQAPGSLAGRRILLVLEHLELGGAEHQAWMLARWLRRERGADAEIWGLGPPGRMATLSAQEGIPCRSVGAAPGRGRTALARAVLKLALEMRRSRPDAVLSYTLVPNVLCAAAAPWSGARLCVWNQRDVGIGRVGRRIERWAAARARAVVSNSRPGAAYLVRDLGVDPGRIRIVPNAVAPASPALSPDAWRERLGCGAEHFLLTMVANFHANKDHDTLIRALRGAVDRWPLPARSPLLILAGRDGGTRERLVQLGRELAVGDRVRFLAPVDDVPGLLGASDLSVLSSRGEGCPNAVLEGMAAGLAIAGTDIEGIRDLVGDEGSALLAPAGDAAGLAERIVRAASDATLRARLGQANRRRALEEFSLERMGTAMAALIEEGLGR